MKFVPDDQREKFEENLRPFSSAEYDFETYVLSNADDSSGIFRNVCKVLLTYWQAIQVIESISTFLEEHPKLENSLHDYIYRAHLIKTKYTDKGLDVDPHTLGTKELPPLDDAVMTRIGELSESYHQLKVTTFGADQADIKSLCSYITKVLLKEAIDQDVLADRLELGNAFDTVATEYLQENNFFHCFFDTKNTGIRLCNFRGDKGAGLVNSLAERILLLARKTCHNIDLDPDLAMDEAYLMRKSTEVMLEEGFKREREERNREFAAKWEAAHREAASLSTVEHAFSDGGQAADHSGLAAGGSIG